MEPILKMDQNQNHLPNQAQKDLLRGGEQRQKEIQEQLYQQMLRLVEEPVPVQSRFLEEYGFFKLDGDYYYTEYKKDEALDEILQKISTGETFKQSVVDLTCLPEGMKDRPDTLVKVLRKHLAATDRVDEYRLATKIASLWLVDDMIGIEEQLKDSNLKADVANAILNSIKYRLTNLNQDFKIRQEIEVNDTSGDDMSSKIDLLEQYGIKVEDLDKEGSNDGRSYQSEKDSE